MSRILVIDDHEDVREELKDRIHLMGHESEDAACAEEALKKLEEMQFECVLLDLGIPVKFEGVARIDHGKNLLQRIVAMQAAPPVIVITTNGLDGHKLAVEMIELGAATFVGKPFEKDPVEPKIKMVLARRAANPQPTARAQKEFKGGVLVLHEDCIELCGVVVGGTRGNAYIRKVVELLAVKGPNNHLRKASAKDLAKAIGAQVSAPAVTSAIKEFRSACQQKLGGGANDVIVTHNGGGYQFADWIEVRIGRDQGIKNQIDQDKEGVLHQIKRHGERTRRQISDLIGMPVMRVKSALSALEADGLISLSGSGSNATYKLINE
jgi:DNA-binding response OmpR family regulator